MNNKQDTEYYNDASGMIPCPSCGCYAYWDGSTYFCDQCGWSGDAEEE